MVKRNEQALLVLTVKNNSDARLYLIESSAVRDYKIEVKDEQGKSVPLSDEGQRLKDRSRPVWKNRKVKLEPGEWKQSQIDLSYLYNISSKGKYYINASRVGTKTNGELVQFESNTIQIIFQ